MKFVVRKKPLSIQEWFVTGRHDKNYINESIEFSYLYSLNEELKTGNILTSDIINIFCKSNNPDTKGIFLNFLYRVSTTKNKMLFKSLFPTITTKEIISFFQKSNKLNTGLSIKKNVQEWFDCRTIDEKSNLTNYEINYLKHIIKRFHIKPSERNTKFFSYLFSKEDSFDFFSKTIPTDIIEIYNNKKDDSLLDHFCEINNKPKSKIAFVMDIDGCNFDSSLLVVSSLISEKDFLYFYTKGKIVSVEEIPSFEKRNEFPECLENNYVKPKNYYLLNEISKEAESICIICASHRWPDIELSPLVSSKKIVFIYPQKTKLEISNYDKRNYVIRGYRKAIKIIPNLL